MAIGVLKEMHPELSSFLISHCQVHTLVFIAKLRLSRFCIGLMYNFLFSCLPLQARVMYDFAAEPGNNELTVNEGEIITITNLVRAQ